MIRNGILILAGTTAAAVLVGSAVNGAVYSSKGNKIAEAMADGAGNNFSGTKDALTSNGITTLGKFSNLKPEAQQSVIASMISGTKDHTGSTIVNGVSSKLGKNFDQATFNEFLRSPTFKNSTVGKNLIKNTLNVIGNKADSPGVDTGTASAIADLYSTWKLHNK